MVKKVPSKIKTNLLTTANSFSLQTRKMVSHEYFCSTFSFRNLFDQSEERTSPEMMPRSEA